MGYSPRTRERYGLQISVMARGIGKPLLDITSTDLKRYLLTIKREKDLTNATVYSQINALRAFFKALEENGVIEENPARPRLLKTVRGLGYIFSTPLRK